ncbi:hypothetical protein [Haloferax chudinovii]|uniref:Cox cluster protein n=1 Tax=Haloferax chudinovii TaxID=1109010 RepID=A0ABD5XI78_9EURY
MTQSDRTEAVLVFATLLVAVVFGLATGIEDHFDPGRFLAVLTPDFGLVFGSDVVAGAVLVVLFGGLAVGAKLLFDA